MSLSLDQVVFVHPNGTRAVNGVSLNIGAGERVAVIGPSGAGKSTLLHVAGLLEAPDQGEVTIMGEACAGMDDDGRTTVRRRHLGFVRSEKHTS